jgi:hypothetical protein
LIQPDSIADLLIQCIPARCRFACRSFDALCALLMRSALCALRSFKGLGPIAADMLAPYSPQARWILRCESLKSLLTSFCCEAQPPTLNQPPLTCRCCRKRHLLPSHKRQRATLLSSWEGTRLRRTWAKPTLSSLSNPLSSMSVIKPPPTTIQGRCGQVGPWGHLLQAKRRAKRS